MKQIILVHGAPTKEDILNPAEPSPSNMIWYPWLQKQAALNDVLCQVLEFTKSYDPVYQEWVTVFQQMNINPETVLIGHSCGGGFLLRYLSEHPEVKPFRVVLVAPWLDPNHELRDNFFDFTIDENLTSRTNIHMFSSSDDTETGIQKSFELIKENLPNATYHDYTDRDHFCTTEFPELRDFVL